MTLKRFPLNHIRDIILLYNEIMEVYNKQFILFTLFCLAAAQKRNFFAQKGKNVKIHWKLSQSVSNEFCDVKKDGILTIFTISMGDVTSNTNNNRFHYYNNDVVSTVFKFYINNVTDSDAGLYSVLRKNDGTNYGEVRLIVTDYPVSSSPGKSSRSTVNAVVGVTVVVVLSLVVIIILVLKRQRIRQISQFQTNISDFGAKSNNGSTYENMADGVSFSSLQPYHMYQGNPYQAAEVTDEKPKDVNGIQNDTKLQTKTETEQTKPNQLQYIEVSFDDDKKTDEPVFKIQSDNTRTTYEEVDFCATANLANT